MPWLTSAWLYEFSNDIGVNILIDQAISIDTKSMRVETEPDYLLVNISPNGRVTGLHWHSPKYTSDLYWLAQKEGAYWNETIKLYQFQSASNAKKVFEKIKKYYPHLHVIINNRDTRLKMKNLTSISFSKLQLPCGKAAIILPFPLPNLSCTSFFEYQSEQCVKISSTNNMDAILAISSTFNISKIEKNLFSQGAKRDDSLADPFGFDSSSFINVKLSDDNVKIICDLANPLHYLIKPDQKYYWDAKYPYGKKCAVPWDGNIISSRTMWLQIKVQLDAIGITWKEENTEN